MSQLPAFHIANLHTEGFQMQMVVGKGYQIESVLIHGELFYDLIQHRVMIATKWKNYKSDFGIGEHMKPGIFL